MKKFYEAPDMEYVSLIANEEITLKNSFIDGDTGVDDVSSDFVWED